MREVEEEGKNYRGEVEEEGKMIGRRRKKRRKMIRVSGRRGKYEMKEVPGIG